MYMVGNYKSAVLHYMASYQCIGAIAQSIMFAVDGSSFSFIQVNISLLDHSV